MQSELDTLITDLFRTLKEKNLDGGDMFLQNMPRDHHYVNTYNQRSLIFCVGQGAWESEGIRTLRQLDRIFQDKGIHAWADFWGYDVNHDWDWWKKQIVYFLPYLLGEKKREDERP